MSLLTQALAQTDLAVLIDRHYPDARGRGRFQNRVRCTWRGGRDFNANLFKSRGGQQMIHDFVTGQTLNAYQFLTEIVGCSSGEATKTLIRDAGLEDQPHHVRQNRPQDPWRVAVLPEFPEDLASWSRVHRRVQQPMITQDMNPQTQSHLEVIGRWLADAILEVMAADAAINAGIPS
jgi:hypothetical protein